MYLAANYCYRIYAIAPGGGDAQLTQITPITYQILAKHRKLGRRVGGMLCYLGFYRDQRNLKPLLTASMPVEVAPHSLQFLRVEALREAKKTE